MIKEYAIIFENKKSDGRYIETTEHQLKIQATCLFDAADYAHNTLELDNIKEVVKV